MAVVEATLKGMGRPSNADALEKWCPSCSSWLVKLAFIQCPGKNSSLRFGEGKIRGMSAKNISKCLKIHKRLTAADARAQEIIAEFDDRFGSRHTLASQQNLDILVTRTHVSGNEAVSRQLLLWCLEHFENDVQRGTVSFDVAKAAFNLAVSRSLLKKRLINYVSKRVTMPAKPTDGVAIPTIDSIFGTFAKFRNSGLDHGSTLVMTWRASMPSYLQDTFDFLTKLMRGGGPLDESLETFLQKDSLVSAELVLRAQSMKDHFDIVAVTQAASQTAQDEKAASAPPPVAPPSPPKPESTTALPPPELPEDPEDLIEAAEHPQRLDRSIYFDSLPLSSVAKDILNKVPDDSQFEQVLETARLRANTFLDLRVWPTDATNLRAALQSIPDAQNRVYIYDTKNETKDTGRVASYAPYRRPPALEKKNIKIVGEALFGDPALAKDSSRAHPVIFRACDMFVCMDGRSPSNQKQITAELARCMKPHASMFPKLANGLITVRMLYHCREFEGSGRLAMARRTCLTQTCPDPMETMVVIQPKAYTLPQRALPLVHSDSYSRAWTGLGLRDPSDMELTTMLDASKLLPKTEKQKAAAEAAEAGTDDAEEHAVSDSDDGAVDGAGSQASECEPARGVLLWPWASSEDAWTSIYTAFHLVSPSQTWIIDFTAGCGLAALAAVRGRFHYVGFATSEVHLKFLRQYVMFRIVSEMVLNVDPHAWNIRKRILCRENSLTGSSTTESNAETLLPRTLLIL
ncbi:unnamed protein product [Symbiodinium sp. CCMP2592]|nr:unnamed protein product [Symbiodinium sp. CCMP2592]